MQHSSEDQLNKQASEIERKEHQNTAQENALETSASESEAAVTGNVDEQEIIASSTVDSTETKEMEPEKESNTSDTTPVELETAPIHANEEREELSDEQAGDELESQTDEDESLQEKIAYEELSRKEILAHLQQLLAEADLEKGRFKFSNIKEAFEKVRNDEIEEHKRKFYENAEEGEVFEELKDQTDLTFYAGVRQYQQKIKDYRKQKDAEQQKNLKLRLDIIQSLKALLDNTQNISQSFDELHKLQEQWRSIGQVPLNYTEELWKTYQHYINLFYDQIKINKELRELDFKRNLELKTKLCEKAEDLILEQSIKLSLDSYKILQEEWRNVGQVAKELSETIWERFKSAGDKLFERRKEYLDQQASKFSEALALKQAICEKAESMLEDISLKTHNDWQNAGNAFNTLMDEWKLAGFANKADNDAIWERFKKIRDSFYDKKEAFYKELRSVQSQNLKLKNDICIEAESLRESTDWKKSAERLKQLQEEWKNIGAISKKQSDKIWTRFRAACDVFFENRKKYFENSDAEHANNLAKKEALIARINTFTPGEDYTQNLDALKAFQAEWIEIGHVPIKQKEAIHKTYRKAIDDQFAKLRAGNDEQRKQLFKAQIQDYSKQHDGKSRISGQSVALQDKLKRIQSDVQLWENNIGFFSASKNADALIKEFNVKIERAKKEIQQIKEQLEMLRSVQSS